MTRIILIILFALSLLVSFSAQAGSRHGHHNKHHGGHHNKHHRHHNKHHRRHHYSRHDNRYGYRYDNYSHTGYPQFYTVPQLALGTRYGYSPNGAIIIYQPYPGSNYRNGY